jgi:hypothetical protein
MISGKSGSGVVVARTIIHPLIAARPIAASIDSTTEAAHLVDLPRSPLVEQTDILGR